MKHYEFSQHSSIGKLRTAAMALTLCLATAASAQDNPDAPAPPSNVKATAEYSKVDLTWDIPTAVDTLLKEDFESATLPEGWSVKTTNAYDPFFSWFHFPTAEMVEEGVDDETYAVWTHNSHGSMMLMLDTAAPHEDESPATQDEWIILPATPGAQYVDFYYMLPEELKEWGTYEEFSDHYYVKVSHDGGTTWRVVWDGRDEIVDGYGLWNHATAYLGSPSEGDPIVAFQALSNQNDNQTGLYCSWAIDDVALLGTRDGSGSTVPVESYNIYRGEELLAFNVKATQYTDAETKDAGTYYYGIQSVAPTGAESDIVLARVDIAEAPVNPPTNVKVTYTYDEETGKYNVDMTWDKPEGDREPAYYMAYANGALFGGYVTDTSVGQTGISKGFYEYTVKAVYEMPDGESEAVGDVVALGTRQAPYNMTYELFADGTLAFDWTAAKASEYEIKDYDIYRGNEKIGETTDNSFIVTDLHKGLYDYSVKAHYADGVLSLPATVSVEIGEKPVYTLPFSEDFTGGMKPGNWTVEKLNSNMKDSYLWRFDNFYELPIAEAEPDEDGAYGIGFQGDFASICSSVAGVTNVFSTLDTPPIKRGASDGGRILLQFDYDFKTLEQQKSGYASEAGVYFSYDGETWKAIDEELLGYTDADIAELGITSRPVQNTYDITDCFIDDDTPIYIAWRYKGRRAYHFAIDNVKIYSTTPTSISTIGNDPTVSRIEVYSADGVCRADITAAGANISSLPLGKGLNIVRVTTANGVKTFKINN